MAKYEYKIQGVDYEVEIEEIEGTQAKVSVNGIKFDVELKTPISVGKQVSKHVAVKPVAAPVKGNAPKVDNKPAPVQAGEGTKVLSPLPGIITGITVKVGDAVAVGDTVVVLEAMKMQNNIEAETAGTVTSVMVNVGDSVMEGTVLVTIA
ncbi:MAG: acetyl-CoA carboxylase biotin carboxyl carrier protein subunit [Prevotella sp.]|nr:acetyl-CoA carboxylase biotin carboxyl carrier protein subunit [Prevotella sp.]